MPLLAEAARKLSQAEEIVGQAYARIADHYTSVSETYQKIAAKFRDALQKENPELFATISAGVWRREWVSFCKHYGRGNDAVLNYLSRYVFRTAISNARILGMDDTHVTFKYKHRDTSEWQLCRLPGIGRYTAGAILSIAFDAREREVAADHEQATAGLDVVTDGGDPVGCDRRMRAECPGTTRA